MRFMERMKELVKRIRGTERRKRESSASGPAPQPQDRALIVGDVHGRADLVLELDELIERYYPGWPVVFLGDYVDRGEHSREVLELLSSASSQGTPPVTCLMGNHERMMLDFLDDPERHARRWLRNGGLQTLASFGIALPVGNADDATDLLLARDALADAVGADVIAWLRGLPLTWNSGNVWAVHAGADPDVAMDEQSPEVLLWGHPAFRRQPRGDGQWVVHGHTVVDRPGMHDGRISTDTGAYATGRLSAVAVAPDSVTFLQAGSG